MAPRVAPYGSWRSPITAGLIASGVVGLGQMLFDGEELYWLETRPGEAGRNVIVRRNSDGITTDITPAPFSARTRAHEYGGGDFAVHDGVVYFANGSDQHLYRQLPGTMPRPIARLPGRRYADMIVDAARRRLICICEDHNSITGEPVNALVWLPDDGSEHPRVLAGGNDFYASPRLSPDGTRLAWLTWNHPNMPWDATELWVGEIDGSGQVCDAQRIAGGPDESIFQPEWSPDGVLHYVSDSAGWWNLYRWRAQRPEPLCLMAAEFARPQWQFGMSTYGFIARDLVLCSYVTRGVWKLARLDTTSGHLEPIVSAYSDIADLRLHGDYAVFRGGSPTEPTSIMRLHLPSQRFEVLRRSTEVTIDAECVSVPESIEFPSEHGFNAHAFFYHPRNPEFRAPEDERAPLLVRSHGGPTAAASSTLDWKIQYWTSRGIAVLDVNYGGSTGFGRAYRQRLTGRWGVVDVADCVRGAVALITRGDVDGERLAITGGSAGGYTALCAVTFDTLFRAGASYYGISDLEALATDTHKFESHYEHRLVGPYPQSRELYRERSPLQHAERISCPVIFFQGLDDPIVPPSQTEAMVAAVRAKGMPVAYLTFPGEQHGFRRAETIKRALEAELYFYARIFGFALADVVEPVAIG